MNISQIDGGFNGRVFVPSNIKNNKQNIIGKCDIRNIIYILIGLLIVFTFFFIFKFLGNVGIGLGIGLFFGSPFFLISFIKIKGLNIEEFILIFRVNKLSSNTVRINNLDNVYEELINKNNKTNADIDNNKSKEKKTFFKTLFNNKKENKNLIDTDDNILKIQDYENNKDKNIKINEVNSLIYN